MKLHPTGVLLRPDNKRVVVRPFIPINPTRVEHIIARALALSEQEAEQHLGQHGSRGGDVVWPER